jgi:glucosamine kinase
LEARLPKLFLGVDGGGTNCRIRLADENLKTLAEARKGRANLQIENGDPGYRAILEGTRDCFAAAGLDYAETASTYACFGMAGARLKSARDEFGERDWPFAGVAVYDDIDIARAGAHGGEDGGVIIAGTGSAAMALVNGVRHQAGGWGFEIGDQMSGAILGREIIRYTVEAEDGLQEKSPLTDAVVAHLGGSNDSIMDWSFQPRVPADYAAIMPLFFEHYEKGDPVAVQHMALQMHYVDVYVNWFKARGATKMAVVGGFADRLFPLLQERYGAFVVERQGEPLDGALILAKQNFGSR